MGSSGSKSSNDHINNIEEMLKNGEGDIETSCDYSEIVKQVDNQPNQHTKPSLPKLTTIIVESNNKAVADKVVADKVVADKISAEQTGGKFDIRNISSRQRYHKYDVFKVLNEVQNNMNGGNQETESSITTDDKAMDHIKNVILSQLTELQKHKQHGAGSCGCDKKELKGGAFDSSSSSSSSYSSSSSSEEGTFQNTKNYIIEESSNLLGGTSDDENTHNKDSSSSSSSSSSPQIKGKHLKHSKKLDKSTHSKHSTKSDKSKHAKHAKHTKHNETSNGGEDDEVEDEVVVEDEEEDEEENEEEGLSIFPFNSSDIKSSASVKNYKMLRRKI